METEESRLPIKPEITYDEFEKLDIRVGKIIEANSIPNSKKLVQIIVDFGFVKRQAVAGLMQYYNPNDLVGKKGIFLLNLKNRMIAGYESQCMVLAADDEKGNVVILQPEKDVTEGSIIS